MGEDISIYTLSTNDQCSEFIKEFNKKKSWKIGQKSWTGTWQKSKSEWPTIILNYA